MGVEITPYHVPAAFILTTVTPFFYRPSPKIHDTKFAAALSLIFGLLCIISILITAHFYDYSYDGQGYHQQTVIELADGWNPIYKRVRLPGEGWRTVWRETWINHYPRQPHVTQAALYKLVGRIEHAKAFNLLLIFASFCLSVSVLLRIRQIRGLGAFIFGLLFALDPVSVTQSLNFYVDGQLSSLLVCLLASLTAMLIAADTLTLASLGCVILMVVNTKFTGVPYFLFIGFGFLVAAILMGEIKELKQVIGVSVICLAVGLLVVGYNPYVTNTLQKGHPLYPIFGEGRIDITALPIFTPPNLTDMNRLERLYYSIFGIPSDSRENAELKLPLTITSVREIKKASMPNLDIGGLGPLFSGALTLSMIGLVSILVRSPPKRRIELIVLCIISACIFTSALIHDQGWRARYAPQLYFIPIIVALLLVSVRARLANVIGSIVVIALMLNVAMVGASYLYRNIKITYKLNSQMHELARADGPVKVYFGRLRTTGIRFREWKIDYKEVSSEEGLPCTHPIQIIRATALVCPDS
ncbi:MAG: hypothetical protein H0V34_02120 [Gammaproteobacteria bacterium]|nr:hypothetical protein [Gammaproteobacteria bacterium]